MTALGWPDAPVEIDAVIRDDIRDDIRCIVGAVRWRLA